MNKVHERRFRNIIRALLESPNPKAFTMRYFVRGDSYFDSGNALWCGSPGCVLGHYAARSDLQRTFFVDPEVAKIQSNRVDIRYNMEKACEHLGVDNEEYVTLFGCSGCNGATTPEQAAEYIEKFIKAKKNGK